MIELRDYQKAAIDATWDWFRNGKRNPLIVAPTGCHERGAKILMLDGFVRCVEDVRVGDRLMGPDSTPRTVLGLCRGTDDMYRITPRKGAPFVVNSGHILALKSTGGAKMGGIEKGDLATISVRDYLTRSKTWKHVHKLFRCGVDFPDRSDELPISPYVLGSLIGDGCLLHTPQICNPDRDVLNAVADEIETKFDISINARSRGDDVKCWTVSFSGVKGSKNGLAETLRKIGLWGTKAGDKFIPDSYRLGSRDVRLGILAGLLDTDGSLCRGGFDYISKSERLSHDVCFVARSLGLSAYMKKCTKGIRSTGFKGIYWRVSISGDTSIIPNKIPRKKAGTRKQVKNNLVTGFSVEPLGRDEFFGFILDGDHLYLTSDFTVHHNSGKSLILSELIRRAMDGYPDTRIVVATHVKELIRQDYHALMRVWPRAPAGIYSAGLGKKQIRPVTFAGIQSVARKADDFGSVDLLIVDEAHLIPRSGSGNYLRFIEGLRDINPDIRIIGLTATPFRLDSGRLDAGKDAIFDGIAYDIPVALLVQEGYLSPLVSKSPSLHLDTSGLRTRMGDYVEKDMAERFNTDDVTRAAVSEIIHLGADRRSWLTFCVNVDHAESVAEEMRSRGVPTATITGKTAPMDRDRRIADYKAGRLRCLTSVGVLTTGFDAPATDLLAFLRPTQSLGLYLQMMGRAMRVADGKSNALILDFAGNVETHGPVDAVNVSDAGGPKKGGGEAPTRVCPDCQSIIHISVRECPDCGFIFPEPEPSIDRTASTAAVMNLTAEDDWRPVSDFALARHVKEGVSSMRVEYLIDGKVIREWVCLEHDGFPRRKAVQWWAQRAGTSPPDTVTEALRRSGEVRAPAEVVVHRDGKYHRITRARGFDLHGVA